MWGNYRPNRQSLEFILTSFPPSFSKSGWLRDALSLFSPSPFFFPSRDKGGKLVVANGSTRTVTLPPPPLLPPRHMKWFTKPPRRDLNGFFSPFFLRGEGGRGKQRKSRVPFSLPLFSPLPSRKGGEAIVFKVGIFPFLPLPLLPEYELEKRR